MRRNPTLLVVCGLMVMAVVAACGDDTTSSAATSTTMAPPETSPAQTVAPGSTELRFRVADVSGYQGFYLLAEVIDPATDEYVGSVCWQIDADPWTGSGTVRTAAAADPCTYDAPYGVVLATDGDYHYVVALHDSNQPAAACIVGDITVDGPTEVSLSGGDFVTPCPEIVMRG